MDSSQEEVLFGRWLRRRRRRLDLTQKALARRVGYSAATIRKVEADARHPSRELARLLGRALGVPRAEMAAFVRFARTGWADRPPDGPRPPHDRPWRAHAGVANPERRTDVAHRPLGRPHAAPVSGETPSSADAPRVLARDAELRRLDHELEQALAGNGRAALIAGEAGQGKTALMTAFAWSAQAAHPELLLTFGTCNAYTGRGDPFLPFRQVLAQLTGDAPAGPRLGAHERERAARLARHVPYAARALLTEGPHLLDTLVPLGPLRARLERAGIAPPSMRERGAYPPGAMGLEHGAERGQAALRTEAAATLTAIADRAPLLLCVDDLHWIDHSSAELLLHLAKAAPGHPILLLGAYRPDEIEATESGRDALARLLHELARPPTTTVDLAEADGRAFIEAWLDSEANDLDEGFRSSLMRQTAGHPLFTIELLRAMQARGDLEKDPAGRWAAAPRLRWDVVPGHITDALAARIEKLDAEASAILRVASVQGQEFTAEVVAEVLEADPRLVVGALGGELDRKHRLVDALDVRRGPAGIVTRYRFRHDLIQRYVHDGIAPGERVYLHQSVAAALERHLGDDADPVALALHYTHAHAPERAAVHHRRAGDRARKAHALDQAIEHYQAALEHWPDPEPATRAGLLRDLGECQWLRLRLEDATRNLGEARAAFEAAGDVHAAGAMQRILALIHRFFDDYPRAFDAARRAVAMLEPAGESTELAIALSTLGYTHNLVAEFAEGAAWGERAVAMARRVDATGVLVEATICVGSALPHLDPPRYAEGVQLLERSIRMADELGQAREACLATDRLGEILDGAGHHREAGAHYRACLEYARRHQIAHFEYYAQFHLWRHAWQHGDWSAAFELLPLVRHLTEGSGPLPFQVPAFALGLAWSELDLGRLGPACSLLQRHQAALARRARPRDRLLFLALRLLTASSGDDGPDVDGTAASIAEAVSPAPPIDHDVIPPVLETVRYLARRPVRHADAELACCVDALAALERHYASPEASAALKEARALEAARGASDAEAATLFTEAADLWQAGAFPLREAHARVAAATALGRSGRRADAERQHRRARTLLSRLGEQIPDGELRASFARAAGAILAPEGRA